MKDNKTVIVAIAALAIIGIISGTYAYFTSTATTVNDFAANTYETVIERTLAGGITGMNPGDSFDIDTLKVKNQGSTVIAVRAKITEESISGSNNTAIALTDSTGSRAYSLNGNGNRSAADSTAAPSGTKWTTATGDSTNGNKDVLMKAIDDSKWVYSNGYFYYQGTLAQNAATDNFIEMLRFNINADSDTVCKYAEKDGDTYKIATDSTLAGTAVDTNKAGDIICTTNTADSANSYTNGTYTLKITFETAQASQAMTYWGVDKANVGATLKTALDTAEASANRTDTGTVKSGS